MVFWWPKSNILIDKTDILKNDIYTNAINRNTAKVINLLVDNNINLATYKDCYNQTLLHIAAETSNQDLAKYLMRNGLDKDVKDLFGKSPLDIAMRKNDRMMVQLLMDRWIDIITIRDDNTRLTEMNNRIIATLVLEQTNNKRLREECNLLDRDNKKLRTENINLHKDNEVLQQTIKNLRGD